LGNLGSAYRSLGQQEKAIDHYQQALQIYEQIGVPDAERVRGWLEELSLPKP
jgi:tetratricopeptide (TPR) repeat protein